MIQKILITTFIFFVLIFGIRFLKKIKNFNTQTDKTKQNDENMDQCQRGAAYRLGATGTGLDARNAKQHCAEQYNVYELEGHWHSYATTRPD